MTTYWIVRLSNDVQNGAESGLLEEEISAQTTLLELSNARVGDEAIHSILILKSFGGVSHDIHKHPSQNVGRRRKEKRT